MAAGLLALAQYIGIIIAMLLTPALVGSDPAEAGYGSGFESMLWIYGVISMVAALLFIFLMRERPAGLPQESEERYPFFRGLGHILSRRDMRITLFLFLIGLGIFNAISSMTDSIAAEAGVEDSDGLIGGLMLIGGIIGALIIPALSDRFRKRRLFVLICITGMLPAVAGLAFAGQLAAGPEQVYTISLVASFILGFFVMSAGPVGFQYAAEVSYPAPESASQGILLWVGQLTGMLFVAGMSIQENRFLQAFMVVFTVLAALALLSAFFLKESPMVLQKG
jgi:Na+/melibiose symporter-like transporter